MTERPILFSAPMVRAILAGTKTQTRRIVKPQPPGWVSAYNERNGRDHFFCEFASDDDGMRHWPSYEKGLPCPYGQPGDQLWVRETWARRGQMESAIYRADAMYAIGAYGAVRWTPSIHMPRWASRIQLELTDVRVERLHALTEDGAIAEGIPADWSDRPIRCGEDALRHLDAPLELAPAALTALETFEGLWNRINGAGAWAANPWVWVVSFRRVTP